MKHQKTEDFHWEDNISIKIREMGVEAKLWQFLEKNIPVEILASAQALM